MDTLGGDWVQTERREEGGPPESRRLTDRRASAPLHATCPAPRTGPAGLLAARTEWPPGAEVSLPGPRCSAVATGRASAKPLILTPRRLILTPRRPRR